MKIRRSLMPLLLLPVPGLLPFMMPDPSVQVVEGRAVASPTVPARQIVEHSIAAVVAGACVAPAEQTCGPYIKGGQRLGTTASEEAACSPQPAMSVASRSALASPATVEPALAAVPSKPGHGRQLTDLFVLVSVDGLRPDVIFPHAPTIQRLRHSGADARNSRTISKSTTLPSHASMVSGVDHDQHGLSFNAYRPERGSIRFPTIFSEAEKAGLSVKLFAGKRKLEHLVTKAQKQHFELGGVYCNRVTALAVPYLQQAEPGVVFIHFADPDGAGHTHGWLSEEYMQAVSRADRCVAKLLDAIRQRDDGTRITMLITSDHGGHNHGHGSRRADDRNIPWVMWGEAVNPKTRIKRAVLNTDTAATVLHTLGLPAPAEMVGTPVLEALLDHEA